MGTAFSAFMGAYQACCSLHLELQNRSFSPLATNAFWQFLQSFKGLSMSVSTKLNIIWIPSSRERKLQKMLAEQKENSEQK